MLGSVSICRELGEGRGLIWLFGLFQFTWGFFSNNETAEVIGEVGNRDDIEEFELK